MGLAPVTSRWTILGKDTNLLPTGGPVPNGRGGGEPFSNTRTTALLVQLTHSFHLPEPGPIATSGQQEVLAQGEGHTLTPAFTSRTPPSPGVGGRCTALRIDVSRSPEVRRGSPPAQDALVWWRFAPLRGDPALSVDPPSLARRAQRRRRRPARSLGVPRVRARRRATAARAQMDVSEVPFILVIL